MKLLRPLAGHTFNDHKTNDSIRRELQTESILDKIDEYRRNWLLHLQRMPHNRIPFKTYHYNPQGGPGSVVGIATAYGLDGPGIESRWGEIFRTSPDRP